MKGQAQSEGRRGLKQCAYVTVGERDQRAEGMVFPGAVCASHCRLSLSIWPLWMPAVSAAMPESCGDGGALGVLARLAADRTRSSGDRRRAAAAAAQRAEAAGGEKKAAATARSGGT